MCVLPADSARLPGVRLRSDWAAASSPMPLQPVPYASAVLPRRLGEPTRALLTQQRRVAETALFTSLALVAMATTGGTAWSEAIREEVKPMLRITWKSFFEKTVLVYDTKGDTLSAADALLDPTSWPGAAIHGSTIFCLGGEGGSRLWRPATLQVGRIEEVSP